MTLLSDCSAINTNLIMTILTNPILKAIEYDEYVTYGKHIQINMVSADGITAKIKTAQTFKA